jgi:hypothetical protein
MLVFSYAVEFDLMDPKATDADDFLREAAKAYRQRAACYRSLGALENSAQRDIKRAEAIEAKIKKTPDATTTTEKPAADLPGRVKVYNGWNAPVTLVIAGVPHKLDVGETRTLPVPNGSSPYEIQTGQHRIKGTLEAGGAYNIKPPEGQ